MRDDGVNYYSRIFFFFWGGGGGSGGFFAMLQKKISVLSVFMLCFINFFNCLCIYYDVFVCKLLIFHVKMKK